MIDRHRVHLREELGDLDQACWEVDDNGVKTDPWQRVVYLVMRDMSNDEVVTFTSTSDGGSKAVAKLADRFDRLRHKHPAKMPVVNLSSEGYPHKKYGRILKPKFLPWAGTSGTPRLKTIPAVPNRRGAPPISAAMKFPY